MYSRDLQVRGLSLAPFLRVPTANNYANLKLAISEPCIFWEASSTGEQECYKLQVAGSNPVSPIWCGSSVGRAFDC